jgi:hypothetical protein
MLLKMESYPVYILIAAILHITEEFFYPGGFVKSAKTIFPRLADRITGRKVLVINSLFVLLCISGILLANNYPRFTLSIAGLIFINGWAHVIGSIIKRSYSPGLITSLAIYIPLSVLIFTYKNLLFSEILLNILYGILYHAVIPIFLFSPFNKQPIKNQ